MQIKKYICLKMFTILDLIFEKGEYLYISTNYRDGKTYDVRKVFNSNKQYLGTIKDDYYYDLTKWYIEIKEC